MSNVIEFRRREKTADEPPPRWICDLAIFESETETTAKIIDANTDDDHKDIGDRYREIADRLDDLSFIFRQYAERESLSEQGAVIGTALVFEDGTVRVRFDDDKVTTPEHRKWLRDQFDLAKEAQDLKDYA
ncbi:hypothetical protein GOL29_03195 [Sinorhizobium medicae]|nr:hypothetical protein [Sinorhizobium medicae]